MDLKILSVYLDKGNEVILIDGYDEKMELVIGLRAYNEHIYDVMVFIKSVLLDMMDKEAQNE